MARDMRRVLISSGRVIDTRARGDEALTGILLAHYHKAADQFATGIRGELPSNVAITGEEAAEVDATLTGIFPDHATAQAQRINDTSSRQMMWAVRKARRLEAEAAATGEPIGTRAVAQMATTFWLRRALGRVTTISVTETEWPAETSKLVEALVLVHQTEMLTLKQIQPISLIPLKVWWSQGDGRVREHHLSADGQQRPATELFVVDGEKLMHPGDATHGATSSNLANCRCSAIYDVDTIADYRALMIPGLAIPPTPDLEVFPITESTVVVGFDL